MPLSNMEDAWTAEHTLIEHEKQPALQPPTEDAFKPRPCSLLGFCVCQSPNDVRLHKRLLPILKSKFPGTHKSPSEARTQLVQGQIVLHIYPAADGEKEVVDTGLLLHVGFVNFQNWTLACLRLYFGHRNPFTSTIILEARGEDGGPQLETRVLLQFLVQRTDPAKPYYLQCYNIVCDRARVSEDMMAPRYVEVHGHPAFSESICFWEGLSDELARSRRQQRPKSAPKPSPSAARSSQHARPPASARGSRLL